MKHKWMLGAVLACGAVVATRSAGRSGGSDPDDRLAAQFDELCKIAKGGISQPVDGVRQLGRYLVLHNGDMLKNFGDTIAMIESIPNDAKHDARAVRARDTMTAHLDACATTWEAFGDAVMENDEASDLVDRAADRLERTLDIISDAGGRHAFRSLPATIERAVDATFPLRLPAH